MFRKIIGTACVLALAIGTASAGDTAKKAAATGGADKAAMMKAEMMKCAVCKNMATHWDELAPAMTMDVAMLNDGVAIMHGVSDPAKAALFHESCQATEKAGMASMSMTDEQAKTGLCSFCQEIRGVMKSGAKMSTGETKMGDVMVITSSDPAVKARIDGIGKQCMMFAEM